MSKARSWCLAGYGNIGKGVARQLGKPEVAARMGLLPAPEFVIRRTGIMGPDGQTKIYDSLDDVAKLPEVFFVAMPSTDNGNEAYGLIARFLKNGKTVITAEKGAMANHFSALKKQSNNFRRLGIDATVGGGTHLMKAAEMYCRDLDNISQIHIALNGTLNALFSSIAPPGLAGKTLGQAVSQAGLLGFAEPPKDGVQQNPYEIIKSEAEGDIPKKIAILFNYLGFSKIPINWRKLIRPLDNEEIDQAIEEASDRRFIVSIYPKRFQGEPTRGPEDNIIGGHVYSRGDWTIVSGFRRVKANPLFFPLGTLTGPKNGAVIALGPQESDGDYWTGMGPGAGPSETVNAMIDDYVGLRRQQQMLDDYVNEALQQQKT